MLKILSGVLSIAKLVYSSLGLVVLLIEDVMGGQPGPAKRDAAIAQIKEVVTGVLGFWPVWIPDSMLGWIIDQVVGRFNSDGTFRKSSSPAPVSPAPTDQRPG